MYNKLLKTARMDKKSIGRDIILYLVIGLIALAAIAILSWQAKDIIISYFDSFFSFFG